MNKVIIRGLNLLHSNDIGISEQDNKAFVGYYQCPLPPLYKAFISSFIVGRKKMKTIKAFYPPDDRSFDIGHLAFFGNHSDYIALYDLLSISESIETMQNAFSKDDEIHKMNYAVIGDCIHNTCLLLGTGGNNADKIFLENSGNFSNNERIIFISENILDFMNNLAICEREHIGYGIKDYDQLYKNWGEDFWRIKDQKSK